MKTVTLRVVQTLGAGHNHLVYADGTTGLHVLSGIPSGTRVAVKARVVRPDGGKSYYTQAELIV